MENSIKFYIVLTEIMMKRANATRKDVESPRV